MSFQNCHIAAIGEKIAKCLRINRWRNFAGDQIRRDWRIKSPGVSLALENCSANWEEFMTCDNSCLIVYSAPMIEIFTCAFVKLVQCLVIPIQSVGSKLNSKFTYSIFSLVKLRKTSCGMSSSLLRARNLKKGRWKQYDQQKKIYNWLV